MQREEMGFLDWIIAGIGLAIGFSIVGAVGTAATIYVLSQQTQALTRAMTENRPTITTPSARPSERPRTVTEYVPARSREECLNETGGVANELYQRCRQGYTRQRQISP